MSRIDVLYLKQKDILTLNVPILKVAELVEHGLTEHGLGRVENPPKPGLHATADSFIHAMPAYFKALGIGGLKWVSGYPDNRSRGLPQIIGLLILNDMETGAPVCVMDGTWITAVRTAAVSAITAKHCARKDSKVLGIVGAGVQGRQNLAALKQTIPGLTFVKVHDSNPAASEGLRAEMSSEAGVEIVVCDDVESTVRGSDIVLTATQRLPHPLVRNEWFGKGSLGLGLEASRAWFGDAILGADRFITDDWNQTVSFHAQGAFPDGLPKRCTELGAIVAGRESGRQNPEERILAMNIGLALEDIIVAHYVYELARDRGLGNTLELFEN